MKNDKLQKLIKSYWKKIDEDEKELDRLEKETERKMKKFRTIFKKWAEEEIEPVVTSMLKTVKANKLKTKPFKFFIGYADIPEFDSYSFMISMDNDGPFFQLTLEGNYNTGKIEFISLPDLIGIKSEYEMKDITPQLLEDKIFIGLEFILFGKHFPVN